MTGKTVDDYIAGLDSPANNIVSAVREVIIKTVPETKESIKWAQPVYESNGPFAYIKAFRNSVNFGFWRGADIIDPKGVLQGTGKKMRHMKLKSLDDIDSDTISDFIRQAIELNQVNGDPTKAGNK